MPFNSDWVGHVEVNHVVVSCRYTQTSGTFHLKLSDARLEILDVGLSSQIWINFKCRICPERHRLLLGNDGVSYPGEHSEDSDVPDTEPVEPT